MTLRRLWAVLNTPSRFEGDPYGGLMNQWGHYSAAAAVFMLACAGWFFAVGEMPPRYAAACALVAAYAVLIEWRTQGWRGRDSIEDTLFVAMGAFTVASSVQEVEATGMVSELRLHVGNMAAAIVCAVWACIAYATARIR